MRTVWIVCRKEFLDTLRDRRTLLTAILLPLLAFPLLIFIGVTVQKSQIAKERQKTLKVAVWDHGNAAALTERLSAMENIELVDAPTFGGVGEALRDGTVDAVLLVSKDFDAATEGTELSGYVNFYYLAQSFDVVGERLRELLDDYREDLRQTRFAALGVRKEQLEVVRIGEREMSSGRELIAEIAGGLVPYLFIILAFASCMYPAMDLGAGEKERGTLETLLCSPAGRVSLMTGKLIVVASVGFVAALLAIGGLAASVTLFSDDIGGKILTALLEILQWQTLALVMALLVPTTVAFAGFQLALSIYANNMKEAQSLLSPATFLVLVPAFLALLPGFELDPFNALIPIFNISLATKAIMAGEAEALHLLLVFLSMFAVAALSVFFCVRWFRREDTLFRK